MIQNKYNERMKYSYLKFLYQKYIQHVLNLEKHVQKLYDDWVIDIRNRNSILQTLDDIIKQLNRKYNVHATSEKNETDDIFKLHISNKLNTLNLLEKKEINDPFEDSRYQLVKLSKKNGSRTINDFLSLFIHNDYKLLIDEEYETLFNIYDEIFVPLKIDIQRINSKYFQIEYFESDCDSLIENTCKIIIPVKSLSIEFIFEGYISIDKLNIRIRTSQICYRHIFKLKNKTKDIIHENYPQVEDCFITRFFKVSNGSCCFVNSPEELAEKISLDYQIFRELNNKNFNVIMKEFCNSDVKNMYKIINLLLMGNEHNIGTAILLFSLLKDKKVSGETLNDIIYHNLSFFSQTKLKKTSKQMKIEMNRLKNLTIENISIEKRLAAMVNMPTNVKSYILDKLNEMKSGENSYKIQLAINGLMQFPWKPLDFKNEYIDIRKSMMKSRKYLQNVAKKLDETVYGHHNSKKVLLELVGKWIQNPESSGQVIGLVGPPGVGKTLLAKSISNALNIPLSIVGLGGMNDAADLIGHSFTYNGAQYGMIIRQMIKNGNWRSVMFFDEVDKVSKRNDTNEIYNTLIHITDPNMNQHFQDRFYSSSIEFDLSGVLIVFSYNDSSKLDPILLDRIKEINIEPYSIQEKIAIAQNYTIKELSENIGFNHMKLLFDDKTIQYIIEKYTLEAGVRDLKRKLEDILLKLNIDRFYMRGPFKKMMKKEYQLIKQDQLSDDPISDKYNNISAYIQHKQSKYESVLNNEILNKIFNLDFEEKLEIDIDLIHRYLDKPTILIEKTHKTDLIGVINGLYVTSIGVGGIVPIQIFKNFINDTDGETNMKLKLTGNLKQIMRESVICAFTTAVNILNPSIRDKIIKNFANGFHIHAPDGGTPKDGPSAGCAFTTAFVSVMINKKTNRNVAMTGEIELTGNISKIGGLYAKLSGAKKAGIKCVYICEGNREDYDNIRVKSPELFNDDFEVKIISHILDIVTDQNVILDVCNSDFDEKIIKEYRTTKPNLSC